MQTVLLTGASGFVGRHLINYLLNAGSEKNYRIIAYSRKKQISENSHLIWIQDFSEIESILLSQAISIDYVINLAGESIGQGRWSDARKSILISSRVETTRHLYQCLERLSIQPKCMISASAIGFYGIDETEQWLQNCDENDSPQAIFMSELCQKWEAEALSYQQNTKIIRLGVVFGKGGGALSQMLLPIKLNMIGRIGTGRQPMTWVHIDDVIRAISFLLENPAPHKVYNVVAPDHIYQMQFVNIASEWLKRKPLLFLPEFVMKLLMGEQAQLVLNGQFVQPKALLDQGFKFRYADLNHAFKEILKQ